MKYHTRKRAVMLVAVASLSGLANAQAPAWENLYPQFRGLAFGAGKFVAVSEDGLIKTSSAGADWSQVFFSERGDTRKISAVAYGAESDRFIALDGGSTFLHSADGVSWGSMGTGANFFGTYIAYGAGKYVAVDNDADLGQTLRYDDDGWRIAQAPGTAYFSHVAYGAPTAGSGVYVAVGRGSAGIASSTNALTWRAVANAPSSGVSAVAFGDGKFVAVASSGTSAYTSSNGTEWTTVSVSGVPANAADMAYGGGKFVTVGANGMGASSSDGTSWTSFTLNPSDNFRAVKYGNSTFMALGANGSVYTSTDGATWSPKASGYIMSYKQIVFGGGKYVAVGDSGVAVSSDGKAWTKKSAGKGLVAVAFGEGKGFVAVGDSGALFTSADGEAWASQSQNFRDIMLTAVTYGGGNFIVGGRSYGSGGAGLVLQTSASGQASSWDDISMDVTTWSRQSQYPTALCFGGGKIVAAGGDIGTLGMGGSAVIMHSPGSNANFGMYWTSVSALPSEATSSNFRIATITYAGDKFVALGIDGQNNAIVLYSPDGTAWAAIPGGTVPGGKSATFASGFYIVAADKGYVYASNGSAWHLQPRATNRNLQTIYSGNNAIIAAGAAGAILHSTAIPTSINHKATPRVSASSKNGAMRIDQSRRAPVVTLSFTPNRAGTIAIYSLTGKQLYKQRLMAGERSVQLPERLKISNSSVIVRYTGEGKALSQRFQVVR